jgi:hypothetical protein
VTTPATAPANWGIGCYDAPDGRRPWRIGNEEIGRDMGSATRRLGALGVGRGGRVLFCSMLSEAGQFWPWIVATMLSGAQLSCADATHGDAVRVAVLLRHMTFDAVIGVNEAVLDGCDERGIVYDDLFGGARFVAARPGAYERLAARGVPARRFALCGPAVAIAMEPDAPAAVDSDEWRLETRDDVVLVTNLAERATNFDRTPVAAPVRVVDDGKAVTWPSAR